MTYFNVMNFPQRHLTSSKHRLPTNFNTFYFPKKSALKKLVNDRIGKFLQPDLRDVWYDQRVHHRFRNAKESLKPALYFENIIGIVQICSTMYLIALIVFRLEMMTVIWPRINYILDYLNY